MKHSIRIGFLVFSFFVPVLCLGQISPDSLRSVYAGLFEKLKPDLQHTGPKLRFDAGLQFPVSGDIRSGVSKVWPGFGFNLGLGYGLNDYLSGSVGFISISHGNDPGRTIDRSQAGFDGFHAEIRVKLNPYDEYQYFLETGFGIYELVDQESSGFTGNGMSLAVGADHFLTREFTMGVSVTYRLTTFDKRLLKGSGSVLDTRIRADMVVISAIFIYTFSDSNKDIRF